MQRDPLGGTVANAGQLGQCLVLPLDHFGRHLTRLVEIGVDVVADEQEQFRLGSGDGFEDGQRSVLIGAGTEGDPVEEFRLVSASGVTS